MKALHSEDHVATEDEYRSKRRLLDQLFVKQPSRDVLPLGNTVRIASWNMERCKNPVAAVEKLTEVAADIICLTEMDVGMARSGNCNTIEIVADGLGMGFCFGVEFIEFGHGNQTEQILFAGQSNREGLHCNAILSRFPLLSPRQVRLSDGEIWSSLDWHSDRIGSRQALLTEIEWGDSRVLVVCTHLESLPGTQRRQKQAEEILSAINQARCSKTVLTGDFNPAELPAPSEDDGHNKWFEAPEQFEPMFGVLSNAGFDWHNANTRQHTRRQLANGFPKPPFKKLDWFFTRGVEAKNPVVVPACDQFGEPISDHELLVVDLELKVGGV